MMKCVQRLSITAVVLMCGGMSSRLAYRYGDGLAYDGLEGIDVRQRFYIRSISFKDETLKQPYFARFQEPLPDPHAVADVVPDAAFSRFDDDHISIIHYPAPWHHPVSAQGGIAKRMCPESAPFVDTAQKGQTPLCALWRKALPNS